MTRKTMGGSAVPVVLIDSNGDVVEPLADAPSDGLLYGRKDATWTRSVAVAGDTMAGTLDFDGNLGSNLVDRAAVSSTTITGLTHTVTPTDARLFRLTLENSPTITLTDGVDGDSYVVVIIQDAIGSRAVTWANVSWGDMGTPTLKTGIGDYNYFTFIYNAVESRWDGFIGGGFT